jgi:hypothetical protein
MLIYIIAGVFITIKRVLMHTVNANTKTGAIYSYKVLVAIGASLAYLVAIINIKLKEIFGATSIINIL